MRAAFTLIEVLAAVAIASIAGMALLKMNSANLFFLGKLKNYAQMQDALSVAGLHGDVAFKHSDKTLYALLDPHYKIENDDLRKYLKSQKYGYSETLVDTISFDTDVLSGDSGNDGVNMSDVQKAASAPLIQFELIKITLKEKQKHGSILQIRPIAQ
jgi:prepilin-type N-terminal cleavage/methylation domain-containing protein